MIYKHSYIFLFAVVALRDMKARHTATSMRFTPGHTPGLGSRHQSHIDSLMISVSNTAILNMIEHVHYNLNTMHG